MTIILLLQVSFDLFNMKITNKEIQALFPLFEPELGQDIVNEGKLRSYNRGEFILQQGQYIRSLMIVIEGLVKILRSNGNGNDFFVHYLQDGEAFALSMINDNKQQTSAVTAVAFKKTTLLAIPLSCMDKWMLEHKSWHEFIFETFRRRTQLLLNTIDTLAFLKTNDRLIYYLKKQEEVLKSKNIPITRTDIAREMNSSREVITRLLKKLATKGKIKMHRKYVEILDL